MALTNCRRCGTLMEDHGWSPKCLACEKIEGEENARAAGKFVYEYGVSAFIKLVIWCFSLPLTAMGLFGIIDIWLFSIATFFFFIIPVWSLSKKFGMMVALSFAFFPALGMLVIYLKLHN